MRIMKYLALAAVTTMCALTGGLAPQSALAQPAAQTPAPAFDAAARRQAITKLAKLLTDTYIYPEMGARAAAMVTQNLESGKYDGLTTQAAFAAQVTRDLRDLTHDKHMRVFAVGQPPQGAPQGTPQAPPPPLGLYGFVQADTLKGNIGYIVLNGFLSKPVSQQGADKAMALVASTDALIIDLRDNNGGDPASVAYLASFFFDGKTPVNIEDLVWRKPGTNEYTRQAFPTEPTPVSYLGKPVYLIVGPRTLSAGEAFTYEMQAYKRATVVGQVTGGGANPGSAQPIAPGLGANVPSGRSESPITHTNWEGEGVHPDIAVSDEQSFATAYTTVLQALGKPAPASGVTAQTAAEKHQAFQQRTTPAPGGEAALRRIISGIMDGNPPYDILGDDLAKVIRAHLPDAQRPLKQLGALQSLTFISVDPMGNDIYEAKFEHGTRHFIIALGADGKVIVCLMQPT